jgi:hypothetical protein
VALSGRSGRWFYDLENFALGFDFTFWLRGFLTDLSVVTNEASGLGLLLL